MFKFYLKAPARPARDSRESYGGQVERPANCDSGFISSRVAIGSQVIDLSLLTKKARMFLDKIDSKIKNKDCFRRG